MKHTNIFCGNLGSKKGFSLIDLLVSISVATLVMSVVLFSYRTFQNKLAVSAAAQEVAVAVRSAQTYSVNVKESATNSADFSSGYGVYFDIADPESYYVFTDKNHDCKYNGDSTCMPGSECVSKGKLKNNVAVSELCGTDSTGSQLCPPPNATGLAVVYPASSFQAPIADANICFVDTNKNAIAGTFSSAKVVTSLADLLTITTQSAVTMAKSGPIYVQPNLPSMPVTNHPPVIALNGSTPMTVEVNSTFVDPGATAMDQEDGDVSARIMKTGSVNTFLPDTYVLTYNISDSGGLSAQTVTRNVIVNSTPVSAPAIANLSPTSGLPGTVVTINGSGFTSTGNTITSVPYRCSNGSVGWRCPIGSGNTNSWVVNSANGTTVQFTAYSYIGADTSHITVSNANGTSNSVDFVRIVPAQPTITNVSPNSGTNGTVITITGTMFTSTNNTVYFVGFNSGTGANIPGVVSANGTSLQVSVPGSLIPDSYTISVQNTNGMGNSSGGAFILN